VVAEKAQSSSGISSLGRDGGGTYYALLTVGDCDEGGRVFYMN
jgi:hypothetical protein